MRQGHPRSHDKVPAEGQQSVFKYLVIWGDLITISAYMHKRVPYSSLGMETPCKKPCDKDETIYTLHVIDARAFMNTRGTRTSWRTRYSRNDVAATTPTANPGVYKPTARTVAVSWNIAFIETLLTSSAQARQLLRYQRPFYSRSQRLHRTRQYQRSRLQ